MTIRCLRSVLADLEDTDAQIVVVDNASGDGSVAALKAFIAEQSAPIRLVESAENTGFSGGHNRGIAACEAEFYLLLNSDAEVIPGFFSKLMAAAERASPESGFIAPRLVGPQGETQISCFRFPTVASEFARAACTGFVTRALRRYEVAIGPEPEDAEIDWASFASILLRAKMVRQIGPMDEGYFLYFEDAEYCLRARRSGWRLARAPYAKTLHYRGGSGPVKALAAARKRLPRYYYLSRSRFFYQAHGRLGLLAANAAWYLGRAFAQFRRLAGVVVHPMNDGEARDIWIGAASPLAKSGAPGET